VFLAIFFQAARCTEADRGESLCRGALPFAVRLKEAVTLEGHFPGGFNARARDRHFAAVKDDAAALRAVAVMRWLAPGVQRGSICWSR
jgi:hypothetical protein